MNIRGQIDCFQTVGQSLITHFGSMDAEIQLALDDFLEQTRHHESKLPYFCMKLQLQLQLEHIHDQLISKYDVSKNGTDAWRTMLATLINEMLNAVDQANEEMIVVCQSQLNNAYKSLSENAKENVNSFLIIPNEIKYQIIQHFDLKTARLFGATSTQHYAAIQQQYPCNTFFYAVGNAIPLCSSFSFQKTFTPREISEKEIMQSCIRPESLRLFSNYQDALTFHRLESPATFHQAFDIYFVYETPAIFIVSLKNGYLIREQTYQFREYWLQETSRASKKESLVCLDTPATNLASIHFAKFVSDRQHCLFSPALPSENNADFPAKFSVIWNEALKVKGNTFDRANIEAIIHLFANYLDCFFPQYRRKHYQQVRDALDFFKTYPTLDAAQECLTGLKKQAQSDTPAEKDHYYDQLLDFSLKKLTELNAVACLTDSKKFFAMKR